MMRLLREIATISLGEIVLGLLILSFLWVVGR